MGDAEEKRNGSTNWIVRKAPEKEIAMEYILVGSISSMPRQNLKNPNTMNLGYMVTKSRK